MIQDMGSVCLHYVLILLSGGSKVLVDIINAHILYSIYPLFCCPTPIVRRF